MTNTLPKQWRDRAELMEAYAPPVARILRECAAQLEHAMRADAADDVSISEAAVLSGYTPDALGRMIRDGRLRNVGNKRRPRVRRGDIPRKPGARALDVAALALDAAS